MLHRSEVPTDTTPQVSKENGHCCLGRDEI